MYISKLLTHLTQLTHTPKVIDFTAFPRGSTCANSVSVCQKLKKVIGNTVIPMVYRNSYLETVISMVYMIIVYYSPFPI